MDPLSLSASIAGLIMITESIVTNGFKYLSEFKESDETIKNLFHEVNLLFGTLHSLKSVAIRLEHEQSSIVHTTRIHHINACDNILRKVEAQLVKVAAKRNTAKDRTRQRVLWPLSKAETKDLLLEVERQKSSLSLALSVDEMSALLNALTSQDIIQKGITRISKEFQSHHTQMNEDNLSKKRQAIIRSLNTIDYNQYQSSNVGLRQAGTGGWFLDGTEFKHWLSAADGKLWIYGIPGAGKTVLMATVVQEVQRLVSEPTSQLGMAFFYCDYKRPETQLASTILGSLVKQLALQNDQSLLDLEAFYEAHNPKGKPPKEVGDKELCDLLKVMASHSKHTMIVIDGLDEIETNRIETVGMLCSLTSTSNIKALFASRDEVDIRHRLADYAHISIAARNGDLRLYVAAEIETRTARHQLNIRDPKLKEHIMKTLITGAEGMFRWVACQMDYLCELNNDDDRRQALKELPHGLPATYERILERVKLKQNQDLVKRTLRWIVCSKEAVLSEVLLAAVSIKDGDRALNHGAMTTMNDIMRWCSSLVRWKDQKMNCIELAHFTVKEFLLSINPEVQTSVADYRIELPRDEYRSAKTCLTILNFDEFNAKPPPRQTGTTSWTASAEVKEAFQYASVYWPLHACTHIGDEEVFAAVKKLFCPQKSNNFLWWAKYFSAINGLGLEKYPEITTLHFAAWLGLSNVVEWLIRQEGVDVNSASQIGTPIVFAMLPVIDLKHWISPNKYIINDKSRHDTIKLLLDGGAQVNSTFKPREPWDDLRFLLSIVLVMYPESSILVDLLLAYGARITNSVLEIGLDELDLTRDDEPSEALLALLKGATDNNVDQDARETLSRFRDQLLSITNEAPSKIFTMERERPGPFSLSTTRDKAAELKTAASNGQLDQVEKCIDILQKSLCETDKLEAIQMALHLAARYHHFSVVEFLLRSGASTEHQDEFGDSPLHQACMIESGGSSSGFKIVELLLQKESDPILLNKAGISPLHIAACFQNVDSVAVLMLLMKANLDSKSLLEHGKLQPSPLWSAIETGCDEVASFLLEIFDIDILCNFAWQKQSCLVPAVRRDSSSILEILIDKGFDVNAPVGDGSFPIHHAAGEAGTISAMKILLAKGAELSTRREDGETALHLAAMSYDIIKMETLLFAGANINSTNGKGRSALQVAVAAENRYIAPRLIDFITQQQDVDINHKNGDGQTVLMISLQHGLFECSDILINRGCDTKTMDDENRTALHYACEQAPSEEANKIILKLVEAGLQLSQKDSNRKSSFELALYSKDQAPPAHKSVPQSSLSSRRREDRKVLDDNLWAPFSEMGESDSEPDTDLDFSRVEYDMKKLYDESTQTFWNLWNKRIVYCVSHMSSDELNRRMSTGRHPAGFLVQYATSTTTKLILEKDVDVNAVDTNEPAIPLDTAAIHGCSSEIATLLIAKIRRPIDEYTGSQNMNPLQLCCAQPNPNMVLLRQLLAAKANPALPTRQGQTPLMLAAGYGSVGLVKALLKHNVPIDAQEYGSGPTALHWAAANSSSECVLALLRAGARVDIKSETESARHCTPLLTAAANGAWDIVEIFVKHNAPASTLQSSGGTSVIHEAASAGEERILRLILELPQRPDLNAKNMNGATPLELAATREDAACFRLLLDSGASLDANPEATGRIVHASTHPISNDVRNLILRCGIRWNVPSVMNCSQINYIDVLPLHQAAFLGNNTCIQFLKQNDLIGNIDDLAQYHMSALHFAACSGKQETVELLLSLGANPETTETRYKRTPLISAARYGRLGVVRTLMDHSCNTAATDNNGWTAYINAIRQNETEISNILKWHEARINENLGGVESSAIPTKRVSFIDGFPNIQSTQRLPRRNPDVMQQFGYELPEIGQRLLKPDISLIADEHNTTNVQTDAEMSSEVKQSQETMTRPGIDQQRQSTLINQSYVIGIVGGFTALLVYVAILLDQVHRAVMDIENYVSQSR